MPVDIAALEDAINGFINVISDPSLAVDQRKEDNVKMGQTIDAIKTLLTDKLDILMRSFEVNNAPLYDLYRSARAIDINGSATTPTVTADVAPSSIKTFHTALSYNANTFYTLQNMCKETVTFSLSKTTDVEGTETVVLNAGETRSRLAENLAP